MATYKTALAISLSMAFSHSALAQSSSQNDQLAEEIRQLQALKKELEQRTREFEQRIAALEQQVGESQVESDSETQSERDDQSASQVAKSPPVAAPSDPVPPVDEMQSPANWGTYEPGKGFVLARTDYGEVDFSVFSYARYLNQELFDDTYTDAFGRTRNLDIRNDIQMQKLTLNFKGWLFDPKFRYLFYTWTANTSQGDLSQVVVAGNLGYQFNENFNLYAGIGGLPSTRSTNYTFPNWLKNDHRTIADEFFRGSYTTGIWASGKIVDGLNTEPCWAIT